MNRARLVLWLLAALLDCAHAAQGQQHPDAAPALAITDLQIGFNGVYKVGFWTPYSITIRSRHAAAVTGELEVQVVDGDGLATVVHKPAVEIRADGDTVVQMLVKPGRPNGAVTVRFYSDGELLARTFSQDEIRPAILATQELFVEIGSSIGLDRVQRLYSDRSLQRPLTALVSRGAALPERGLGYEVADLVVLTTSDAATAAWQNHPQAVAALDQWVRLGGKLLFSVGREGERVLADGSPLAHFAPGKFQRVINLEAGPWESFAGATAEPMQGDPRIATTVLGDVRGRVELRDQEVPLVVRKDYGLGEVLFVAADLDQPPFATWPARTKLLATLLGRSEMVAGGSSAAASDTQSVRLGYTDLAGQLRSALGQFTGASVVPFWLIFLLAFGYAALIFPAEYWLARWLRPRFEAAWLLLPAVLAAGAIGVWYIAVAWKGEVVLLKKVETTDVDLGSGIVRGHSWLGLFSPHADAYDLAIRPRQTGLRPLVQPQLSWLGLPGTGLGGMNSQIAEVEQFERAYHFNDDGGLAGIPLVASSSKAFEAAWHTAMSSTAAALGQRPEDDQPLGNVRNDTGIPLRNCLLFYEGWSYQLGTLEPRATVNVGKIQRVQRTGSYLTGRTRVGDKEQTTPHDPDGADLLRIVRALLFYDAAGGRQYTALSNRIYAPLDLTGQLRLGRAVLFATGPPATEITVTSAGGGDAQLEQDLAFYRFVIPVGRGNAPGDNEQIVPLRIN